MKRCTALLSVAVMLFVLLMSAMPFVTFAAAASTPESYTVTTMTSESNRTTTSSLLPPKASDFLPVEAADSCNGTATVEPYENGYKVTSDQGWPSVYYTMGENGFWCYDSDDLYLNYEFEVVSGETCILVFFAGQHPKEQPLFGTYVSLNELVDPLCVGSTGTIFNLPVGKYSGSVSIRELGYREDLIGFDGRMLFSGCKIFAVGENGEVIVKQLEIGFAEAKPGNSTTAPIVIPTTTKPQHDMMIGYSMMPPTATDFTFIDFGNGEATVEKQGIGYKVTADQGWPGVYYNMGDMGYYCYIDEDLYLHYNFEVVSGATTVYVYFAGQAPQDFASPGSFVCINGLVDPSCVDSQGHATGDLPVGKYRGSVSIRELGYSEDLLGEKGEMLFSGCKIFAIGKDAEVIVHQLSIGYWHERSDDSTTTEGVFTTTGTASTEPWSPLLLSIPATAEVTPVTSTTAGSLLPVTEEDFALEQHSSSAGGGTATVAPHGRGYRVTSDYGWPSVYYDRQTQGVWCYKNEDLYLNYDFEVVSGKGCVLVYFAGQNPQDQPTLGTFIALNGLEDPSSVDEGTGQVTKDLPVGRYSGSVSIRDLGYREDLTGMTGQMLFSGCRIFAVGVDAQVIVHDLGIGSYNDGYVVGGNNTLRYKVNEDGQSVTVVGSSYLDRGVKIPERIAGLPVTAIGEEAFRGCGDLYAVSIPGTVKTVEDGAFSGCYALHDVYFGGNKSQWKALGLSQEEFNWEMNVHYGTDGTDHWQLVYADHEASCYYDTGREYTCACGYYRYMTIPAQGHSFTDNVCDRCSSHVKDCLATGHPYDNYSDYEWRVYQEGAKEIILTFSPQTNLEEGCDILYIYGANDRLIGVYSGSQLAGCSVTVEGDTVRMRFTSDDSMVFYGFEVTDITVQYDHEGEDSKRILGDLDLDGYLNTLDVVALFDIVSGNVVANAAQMSVADFDGDGDVNTLDVVAIFNKIAGLV